MAVIDEVPGLEVRVVVNDQALREYDDPSAKVPSQITERYVEAQDNATFRIHYSFQPPFPADRPVSMIVTIDGNNLDEPVTHPFDLFQATGHTSTGAIARVGENWQVQKYCFSAIEIRETDNEVVPVDILKKLEPVGVITCEFYFLDQPQRNRDLHGAHKEMKELPPISEKAIKGDAISHQATLRDFEPTEEVEYYDANYANGGEPFATFHFYYRSMESLKNLHIIERIPEPEPFELLDSDDSVLGQMNREQLEAIVRRFREQEESRLRLKRERSSSETVVGDDYDVGDRCPPAAPSDPDLIEMRWVDLRAKRMAMRVRKLPGAEDMVIEID